MAVGLDVIWCTYSFWSTNKPMKEAQAEIIMDAFRNSSNQRPQYEWIGGKVAQQLVS